MSQEQVAETPSLPVEAGRNYCGFCKTNGEPAEFYKSHKLRDRDNKITCPVLSHYTCPICKVVGRHTASYCPKNENRLPASKPRPDFANKAQRQQKQQPPIAKPKPAQKSVIGPANSGLRPRPKFCQNTRPREEHQAQPGMPLLIGPSYGEFRAQLVDLLLKGIDMYFIGHSGQLGAN